MTLQTLFADAFGRQANAAQARGDIRTARELAALAYEIAAIPDDPEPPPTPPKPDDPATAVAVAAPKPKPAPAGAPEEMAL